MFARKSLLAVATVIAGLLLPAQAMAYEAYTRVDLNLRVGPDTGYGVIDVIPYGDPVHVIGCLNGVEWCDVEWYGLRGWVAAYYLVQPGTSVYLPHVYTQIGLPIIVFSFDSYHDRYYRDRPWYKKRVGIWRGEKWRRGDRPKNYKEAVKPGKGQKKQVVLPPQETEQPRKRKEADRPRKQQEVEQPQQKQKVERPRKKQEAEAPKQGQRKQTSKQQAKETQKEAKRAKKKRNQEEESAE